MSGATHFGDPESERLRADSRREKNWKRWGPYLSERQWATVREDYSPDGNCWEHFPHDQARSRAYRWGEDGLLGFTDRECRLCFALALWNGKDPFLKERLFGVTGPEGNHGEDVKELYYYTDSTPTHSYTEGLYRYPSNEYPYAALLAASRSRGRHESEFELEDTGIFDGNRYFDVRVRYAKAAEDDLCILISVRNRGPVSALLHLVPTFWYRNTWSWGCTHEGCFVKPIIRPGRTPLTWTTNHITLGRFEMAADSTPGRPKPEMLATENETNFQRLYGVPNAHRFAKDAFHDRIVSGRHDATNPALTGTKVGFWYQLAIPPGGEQEVRLRLTKSDQVSEPRFGPEFDDAIVRRKREADAFYERRIPKSLSPEERNVARQAYAGLLWTKQFYHYVITDWLNGDPDQPPPPEKRRQGRNSDWSHLFNRDIISMPDKWEYPWYAAWDLAFHMIPMARIDPGFAKDQLLLLLREWYMHPNGQIPAYEFAFSDVNPPVHAWACWRVYKLTGPRGGRDRLFLARTFQKLLINFTWWVNRKDVAGKHIFSGGFLGLDNIGVFDRSKPLPTGGHLEQADGTAWMAFYCATMLSMALELAKDDPSYEDVASKFFEHFVAIADAMNTLGGTGLWDEIDGFYYDQLHVPGRNLPLRIRSMVGLIPLFVAEVLDEEVIGRLPGFTKRMQWFLEHKKDLARHVLPSEECGEGKGAHRVFLAIPTRERLLRVLKILLDESEFLSPYGIRSLSKRHAEDPFSMHVGGEEYKVEYVPGESTTSLFGGNSNWRGPIWFPVNYLLIEALGRYHYFYGDALKVECPTGSGNLMNLHEVSQELSRRLSLLFLPKETGRRPCHGDQLRYAEDPAWKDLLLFHEYFHGDTGRGCGASHQTGWTALIARCLEDLGRARV